MAGFIAATFAGRERTPLLQSNDQSETSSDRTVSRSSQQSTKSLQVDEFSREKSIIAAMGAGAAGYALGYFGVSALIRPPTQVPVSLDYWADAAREQVYLRCYDGCASDLFKNDPVAWLNCPAEACRKSALVAVKSVTCDTTRLWHLSDRIPAPCLEPLGVNLREAAIEELARHTKHHYILAVLAGAVLGCAVAVPTYFQLRKLTQPKTN